MRVTNTAPYPRVLGYAGNRNVPSGGTTPDLKFETLHNPLVWKDIANGHAAIRLSDSDKALIQRIQAADQQPIVVQKLAERNPPRPVVRTPVPPAKAISASPVPVAHDPTPIPASALPVDPARPSLADLKRMNAAPPSKLDEIRTFMGGKV